MPLCFCVKVQVSQPHTDQKLLTTDSLEMSNKNIIMCLILKDYLESDMHKLFQLCVTRVNFNC